MDSIDALPTNEKIPVSPRESSLMDYLFPSSKTSEEKPKEEKSNHKKYIALAIVGIILIALYFSGKYAAGKMEPYSDIGEFINTKSKYLLYAGIGLLALYTFLSYVKKQ